MAVFIAVGLIILAVHCILSLRLVLMQACYWGLMVIAKFGIIIYGFTLYFMTR